MLFVIFYSKTIKLFIKNWKITKFFSMNDIVKSKVSQIFLGSSVNLYTRETYCLFIIINLSINFLSVLKVQVFKKKKKKIRINLR